MSKPDPDLSFSLAPPTALSVSTVNRLARELLEGSFPALLVEGEISGLSIPASGHWYFTLKDEQAQLRAAMFRNRNQRLLFRPRNGMQILVRGRLSIYEGRGDYQLIAEDMEDAGAGALRRAFEELKAKLTQEGLFDIRHKRRVGNNYQHIGIITSPTGAVIHDMLTVFRRRFPAIKLTLIPVPVQGAGAAEAICQALQTANRLADQLGLQALILGRGGGSLEDMQAFNDESVARAIHGSRLPVVSAVGHETDFSIADLVADLRAPTPTAAAELMSQDHKEILFKLRQLDSTLQLTMTRQLQQQARNLDHIRKRLRHPGRRLQEQSQFLDHLEGRLTRAMRIMLKQYNSHLVQLARNLNAISPLQTLGRGYSITYDENHNVLVHSSRVKRGARLTTRLLQGMVVSRVEEIQNSNDADPHHN